MLIMKNQLLIRISFIILLISALAYFMNFTGKVCAQSSLKAFPEAEGYGAFAKGGRGNGDQTTRIFVISNLNDRGSGSLRECVQANGPRFCIFKVSGYIWLDSPLEITKPYITIAGQTAPGDGVTVGRYPLIVKTNDVVVRYMRFRLSDWQCQFGESEDDALTIEGTENIIIDHCSTSWGTDETLSLSQDDDLGVINNVTVQWTFITESLNYSCQYKDGKIVEHGYGSIIGGDMRNNHRVSFHHNLFAHHKSRNPRFSGKDDHEPGPVIDFRNNLIYNWQTRTGYSSSDEFPRINYIGNYLKPGPSTLTNGNNAINSGGSGTKVYLDGNYFEEQGGYVGWEIVNGQFTRMNSPLFPPSISMDDAQSAKDKVLNQAGAVLPARDEVDNRIVNEVRNRGGRIINSQNQVGGWPNLSSASPSPDADGDGMPDHWEDKYGLNKNNSNDNVIDSDGDGYLNIEEYINGTAPAQPTPTTVQTCKLGDSDCNQLVEFGDYSSWRTANWDNAPGDTGDCSGSSRSIYGDASCDGVVNNFDFSIWRSEMFD